MYILFQLEPLKILLISNFEKFYISFCRLIISRDFILATLFGEKKSRPERNESSDDAGRH